MIKGSGGFCKFEGCGLKHYARGFCRKHYIRICLLKIAPEPYQKYIKGGKMCLIPKCGEKGYFEGYCFKHWTRVKRGLPFDINLGSLSKMGGKNPRWKGGIAEYEKHYLMKKIGKEKLESANYICQICLGQATEIHHLDKTKNNHALKNLLAICHKCHFSIFHREKHTSKYLREYGLRLYDIKKKLHFHYTKIKKLHISGKLKGFLDKGILLL